MHLRESIRHILAPHPTPAESSATIDLAMDCIAPLSARDARGSFTSLASYYNSLNRDTRTRSEPLGETRQLGSSSIHQQLVRLYRDHDPSLLSSCLVAGRCPQCITHGTNLFSARPRMKNFSWTFSVIQFVQRKQNRSQCWTLSRLTPPAPDRCTSVL